MRGFMKLPEPALQACTRAGLSFLTDEPLFAATSVRMGFTRRMGGVSERPYDSLNLGSHVGDSLPAVEENRRRLLAAADLDATALLTLNQVHGSRVLTVSSAAPAVLEATARAGAEGADGLAVGVPAVTALLCFADCVPVVVVSPSGAFAVAHAGWRGALAGIPARAVRAVAQLDAQAARSDFSPSDYNGYIGPHIMAKCYECGEDVISRFVDGYGKACAPLPGHLSLEAAVRASFAEAGLVPQRIASAGECTACSADEYFSYRESGGRTGRHGAFAGRKEE